MILQQLAENPMLIAKFFSFFLFSFFHGHIMLTATGLTVVHNEHVWSAVNHQAIRSQHQHGQFSVSLKIVS
jgi:hypothetical protein